MVGFHRGRTRWFGDMARWLARSNRLDLMATGSDDEGMAMGRYLHNFLCECVRYCQNQGEEERRYVRLPSTLVLSNRRMNWKFDFSPELCRLYVSFLLMPITRCKSIVFFVAIPACRSASSDENLLGTTSPVRDRHRTSQSIPQDPHIAIGVENQCHSC